MIVATAKLAPNRFDKTSKTSALLVVVKNCCVISMKIPKIKENTNANAKGLELRALSNFFFKYKNHSVVNTKCKIT